LGVIFASQKRFGDAVAQFRYAGEWNPALPALDRNWGMAAFYAEKYRDAIPLLTRHLRWHPDDVRARAALALSFFMREDFAATLEALRPIPSAVVENDPGLGYAFAVSLLRAGDYNEGVRRLQELEKANPDSADVHMLLGEAYAEQQDYATALDEYRRSLSINPQQSHTRYLAGLALLRKGNPADAVQELRASLQLAPDSVSTKYHLAYALIESQQKQEAQVLLQEVIRQNPQHSDAFYQLGKLQLEHGDIKAAIAYLETGSKLSPDSDYIHYQLAMAYRRDGRGEDAEREIKLYQVLKQRHRGRDVPESK
jgi:tetratricopeptide (TPR) repeat protein